MLLTEPHITTIADTQSRPRRTNAAIHTRHLHPDRTIARLTAIETANLPNLPLHRAILILPPETIEVKGPESLYRRKTHGRAEEELQNLTSHIVGAIGRDRDAQGGVQTGDGTEESVHESVIRAGTTVAHLIATGTNTADGIRNLRLRSAIAIPTGPEITSTNQGKRSRTTTISARVAQEICRRATLTLSSHLDLSATIARQPQVVII